MRENQTLHYRKACAWGLIIFFATFFFDRTVAAETVQATHNDISKQTLLEIVDAKLPTAGGGSPRAEERENPRLLLPSRKSSRAPLPSITRFRQPDQRPTISARIILNGDGIRSGVNYHFLGYPPDPNGAVGLRHYVQWVNGAIGVFQKTDGKLAKTPSGRELLFAGNKIWQGFGGFCEKRNDGDPVVLYDKLAGRWLLTQFAFEDNTRNRKPRYAQCLAISSGPDFLESRYFRYEFPFDQFNDYPKFGVWPDAYFATFNTFTPPKPDKDCPPNEKGCRGFMGAKVCAFDRQRMLEGRTTQMECANPLDGEGNKTQYLLPADLDGNRPPPKGAPGYAMSLDGSQTWYDQFGTWMYDAIDVWQLHVDWSARTKLVISQAPLIRVNPFVLYGNSGIPQKDTHEKLDPLNGNLMNRLAYRNFGDHESFVASHSVVVGQRSGIRWYEFRRDVAPNGTASREEFKVLQQEDYAPEGLSRWLPSIAADKNGNLLMAYNASDGQNYPSIRFAENEALPPADPMSEEGILKTGERSVQHDPKEPKGAYVRWGDYTSVAVDPEDDCTFWVTGEYYDSATPSKPDVPGGKNIALPHYWDTIVAALRFQNCN